MTFTINNDVRDEFATKAGLSRAQALELFKAAVALTAHFRDLARTYSTAHIATSRETIERAKEHSKKTGITATFVFKPSLPSEVRSMWKNYASAKAAWEHFCSVVSAHRSSIHSDDALTEILTMTHGKSRIVAADKITDGRDYFDTLNSEFHIFGALKQQQLI